MAFVVCEPCHDCKYTDCVVVCPCSCFYEDSMMLTIDPEHCIDCEECVPECPVEAIYHDSKVPGKWEKYIALNAEISFALKQSEHQPLEEKKEAKEGLGCKKRA